jgi:hypothetical protein
MIFIGMLVASLGFLIGWFGNGWFGEKKSTFDLKAAPIVSPIVDPNEKKPNPVIVEIGGKVSTNVQSRENQDYSVLMDSSVVNTASNIPAVDITQRMPVSGTITAKFIDKKNNADLGSETKPLMGMAAVKGNANNLSVVMDFSSELTFGVNIPKEPDKLWHFGFYAAALSDGFGAGVFGQRDFKLTTIKNVDLIGFGRVEMDKEPRLLLGVEGNF